MLNRGRNYMDRILGRNEGSESRDFTDGKRYGEEQRFFDEEYIDTESRRTQASGNIPRQYKSDYDRDYSVRRNPPREERSSDYNIDSGRGFFGKGPKGWKRSDERIKEEVSEALYRDYHVDASEIEVEVKEGIVTLNGTVDSRAAKRSAEECIDHLSGVSDVHNRIRITNDGQNRALS